MTSHTSCLLCVCVCVCFLKANRAKCFILITNLLQSCERPKDLATKAHLEGTHGLPQTTTSSSSKSSFSPRSESAKATSTSKQRDEQQKAHILTVSASQLLNWKVEKKGSDPKKQTSLCLMPQLYSTCESAHQLCNDMINRCHSKILARNSFIRGRRRRRQRERSRQRRRR